MPICVTAQSQRELLELQLKSIADSVQGTAGIGVMGLDFEDTLLMNEEVHYPMQSVYKFPLALVVLNKVDKKELSLQKRVRFKKSELMQETWSPMLRELQEGEQEMTIAQLLLYAVSKSDNNACDLLFEQVGGVGAVDRYCKRAGAKEMAIAATERQMAVGWQVQYTNWCKPASMLRLLQLFYEGKLLKESSNAYLMKLMVESENSPNRLKEMLPSSAVVAHKTGTSNTNAEGVRAATNDVGIVTLPDGRHYAIVVCLKDYKASIATGEKAIATISKAVWDYTPIRKW
jgi:beta-lactamase class A